PLWFGNQQDAAQENPVYGTAQVLKALRTLDGISEALPRRAIRFLLSVQDTSGAWGGNRGLVPSIEETALAATALALWPEHDEARKAAEEGEAWLLRQIPADGRLPSAPVGLYFASLWYDEKLYPLIFALQALKTMEKR
ncbi:MAG: squalene--hopene cyclase, partial [Candidatus Sumerlaeota bacterium]